jgi:hypothetical protein
MAPMRAILPCLLLVLSACHSGSSSPSGGPDATLDGTASNECVLQGFMCQTQAGCEPGYQEVDDLFCGTSGAYCCELLAPMEGGTDAAADVVPLPDAAPEAAPDGGMEAGPPPSDGAVEADGV